jgi:hypothetical protein
VTFKFLGRVSPISDLPGPSTGYCLTECSGCTVNFWLSDRKVSANVKKLLVVGAGAALLTLLGAAPAAADDGVVGHSFADAKATLSERGLGAVVATTVGDRQNWDDCIVSSATRANFKDASGNSTGNNVLVNLNCYSRHSTANSPGYSAASPEGRASQAIEQQLAAQQAAEQQAQLAELAAADAPQGDG